MMTVHPRRIPLLLDDMPHPGRIRFHFLCFTWQYRRIVVVLIDWLDKFILFVRSGKVVICLEAEISLKYSSSHKNQEIVVFPIGPRWHKAPNSPSPISVYHQSLCFLVAALYIANIYSNMHIVFIYPTFPLLLFCLTVKTSD
jgi:hypothetical protein